MLQKFTNNSVTVFYNLVDQLDLKFPIANIAEKTGYSKGNVSDILRKKKEPSRNFLEKFFEAYSEDINKIKTQLENQNTSTDKFRLSLKNIKPPVPIYNTKAAAGTIEFINDEPELIVEFMDAPFIGYVDGVIEVVGDSMYPTFKNGTRIAVTRLTDPQLIYWGEYYYVIDKNYQGVVKRLYEGDSTDHIVLKSDNTDQNAYPPIKRKWEHIEAIFKVKADITKH